MGNIESFVKRNFIAKILLNARITLEKEKSSIKVYTQEKAFGSLQKITIGATLKCLRSIYILILE